MKQTLIMLSMCVLFFGCTRDWGSPTTKNYPINRSYTGLEVSSAFQVTVSDEVNDVVVTVGNLAHPRVIVKVKEGKLHIGFKPHTTYNGLATAVIPASVIRDLELSGASSFTGNLGGDKVEIDLSGASSFNGNIDARDLDFEISGASTCVSFIETKNLDIELSGASTATIEGRCWDRMEMELSGASHLNAIGLDATDVHGTMSGASDADVTCCSNLNVELSGASTLTYGTYSNECHLNINCPASGGSVVRPRN